MAPPEKPEHRHGLSFLATLAFAAGFFGARIFHLVFPSVMIITQGIHFHHFWYGLAMMGIAGWLGIAANDKGRNRAYAVVFGLGAGFVGDEVGLLLTFGDYYSTLTSEFFVAAVAVIILAALLVRYWKEIERDVLRPGRRDLLLQLGVFLVGFSFIFFAFDVPFVGVPVLVLGILLPFGEYLLRRRRARERAGWP